MRSPIASRRRSCTQGRTCRVCFVAFFRGLAERFCWLVEGRRRLQPARRAALRDRLHTQRQDVVSDCVSGASRSRCRVPPPGLADTHVCLFVPGVCRAYGGTVYCKSGAYEYFDASNREIWSVSLCGLCLCVRLLRDSDSDAARGWSRAFPLLRALRFMELMLILSACVCVRQGVQLRRVGPAWSRRGVLQHHRCLQLAAGEQRENDSCALRAFMHPAWLCVCVCLCVCVR